METLFYIFVIVIGLFFIYMFLFKLLPALIITILSLPKILLDMTKEDKDKAAKEIKRSAKVGLRQIWRFWV
ncbi:MAG: hypothetical protein HND52_11455 [Ignavibacteriae bacterium]|jgi:hypothetical protein|nr:hypothetical protein [Ignavibacteriota bacterium]NOG98565.1 hypothetical protein [Ignavibacteriota bacterium]